MSSYKKRSGLLLFMQMISILSFGKVDQKDVSSFQAPPLKKKSNPFQNIYWVKLYRWDDPDYKSLFGLFHDQWPQGHWRRSDLETQCRRKASGFRHFIRRKNGLKRGTSNISRRHKDGERERGTPTHLQ